MSLSREALLDHLYTQLRHQISVYTGKRDGGLSTFQNWYHNHHLTGDKTTCECCGQIIEDECHSDDCEIVIEYCKYFACDEQPESES